MQWIGEICRCVPRQKTYELLRDSCDILCILLLWAADHTVRRYSTSLRALESAADLMLSSNMAGLIGLIDLVLGVCAAAGPSRQVMRNFGDAQYVSEVSVGGQRIPGIVDTGSSELVVLQSPSHYISRESAASKPGSAFLMAQQTGHRTIMRGQVSIGLSETDQSFRTGAGSQVHVPPDAAFGAIVGVSPERSISAAWDAAEEAIAKVTWYFDMGMSAPEDVLKVANRTLNAALAMSQRPSLLQTHSVQNFSVCIGARSGSDGLLVWNDESASQYPEFFSKIPVEGTRAWVVRMANVQLSHPGTRFQHPWKADLGCSETACTARLDSSVSLLAAPAPVVERLREAMAALHDDCTNLADFPDLTFRLGGVSVSLPPQAYVAEVLGHVPEDLRSSLSLDDSDEAPRCQLLLAESSQEGRWVLGVPFFQRFYTTFSTGQEASLYIAPHSTRDCEPAKHEALLSETDLYVRQVEAQRIRLPHML
mmetsp:Transcript_27319/g.84896  ORF Transcript_27319/g.84896 Transcript_27319/m.84896 type:complete len:480 (-) Transcript_27319:137-1576(-)